MGLEMYAFATTETLDTVVDFLEPASSERLHQWRKHPELHAWMARLYVQKGGVDADFNLSPVVLDAADIDRLEATITEKCKDDLAFVAKARKAFAKGRAVYYAANF